MVVGSGPAPLWQQIVSLIRKNIEQGVWPVNHQIPSERELCDTYQISRTTVRLAIAEAENKGLLTRIHGKGTYVAQDRINQSLVKFTTFAETLMASGIKPSTRVISIDHSLADAGTALLLMLAPGDPVVRFRTMGLGNGEPMALYDNLVPATVATPVIDAIGRAQEFTSLSLVTELLADCHDWSFLKAEQSYTAGLAQPEEARLLQVPRKAAVLRVASIFANPAGQPVDYRQAAYRADKYQFQVTRELHLYRGGHGQ